MAPKPYTVLEGAVPLPRKAVEEWHPGTAPLFTDLLHVDQLWIEWKEREARTRLRAWFTAGACMLVGSIALVVHALVPPLAFLLGVLAWLTFATKRAQARVSELARHREGLIQESNAQIKVLGDE